MDTTALKASVTSLEASLDSLASTLATETAAHAANPRASYTVSTMEGSQSVDWNGYRKALTEQMESLQRSILSIRQLINAYEPYAVNTRMYT